MAEEKKIATGYIGNALRSTAADHTTTFADEIFDTERQQYQNEVNTDLEQAITDEVARAQEAELAIIFDVSSHNDGAVFESLSALLSSSNLSQLIPTSVRHGGMSIRFIQSSDNKYVQYRLMSDTFNTTVDNWQGIDDEPIAGSENLVKSNGVANKLTELGVKVTEIYGGNVAIDFSLQIGHFFKEDGSIGDATNSKYTEKPIDVSKYKGANITIKFPVYGEQGVRKCFFKKAGEIIATFVANVPSFTLEKSDADELYISYNMHVATEDCEVSAEFNVLNKRIEDIAKATITYDVLKTPRAFTWKDSEIEEKIHKNGSDYIVDYDITIHRPTTGVYFVNPEIGSDDNIGDRQHPFRTISSAYVKSDVRCIVLTPYIYKSNLGINDFVTKDIALVCERGKANIIASPIVFWSAVQDRTNVWKCTRSNALTVINLGNTNSDGGFEEFIQVSSIAEVESTHHSFFLYEDNVYINFSISPSDNICVLTNSYALSVRYTNGGTFYAENIRFIGCGRMSDGFKGALEVLNNDTTQTKDVFVYLKGCVFCNGFSNGLGTRGAISYAVDCEAHHNKEDGFNYHTNSDRGLDVATKSVEINCKGYCNGESGMTDNGSTIHDGASIIRVGCEYYKNLGPNVGDVGDGSQSWNIGCYSHHCGLQSDDVMETDFRFMDKASYWMEGCSALESKNSLSAETGAKVYVKSSILPSIRADIGSEIRGY